jgi:hypothetical protein
MWVFVAVESALRMHCDLSKSSDVDFRAYQGTTAVEPKDDARFNAVKRKNNVE